MSPQATPPSWAYWLTRLGDLHRRYLGVLFSIIGPRAAYQMSQCLAKTLYRLLTPLRDLSERQCAASLGRHLDQPRVRTIAEKAFVHRIWNLTDLALSQRYIHKSTYHCYGGQLPREQRESLTDAQNRGQPCIFVTAYYGPYDLLPLFLGYNELPVGIVYRRHANSGFDRYRYRARTRSGCEMIPLEQAASRCAAILSSGGMVAILADHHDERRGVPISFLNQPTYAPRSIALMAWRYEADVVVSGIRRVNESFRFELLVSQVIKHDEWQTKEDPVTFITERYTRGIERMILEDPTQYLWAYPRWGIDLAQQRLAQSAS